jgi:hypothetical protein
MTLIAANSNAGNELNNTNNPQKMLEKKINEIIIG